MQTQPLKESDLYLPVKRFLESCGYQVNAEVKNCDITATRNGELVVVELKSRFNATLLVQAVDRQRAADAVYVALPHPCSIRNQRRWQGMCHLLKRLEIGLILVRFLKSGPTVMIAFHPVPYSASRQHKRRRAIIREIQDRTGNYNTAGVTGVKLVTSYREDAIHLACLLESGESLSPGELKRRGAGEKTQSILRNNYYGWFERVERGVYRLHSAGKKALSEYPEIAAHFRKTMGTKPDEA